ncbi:MULTISPECIES: LLM class flavin-dependent oxidoreductase [unclassified Sphingomonas]|uniref:LLM class flavin-dependent oxidoreductase n=1 Tax=unclassified Sphingomonas TaxID=196159 RepID=UPI0006FC3724|nr:MULTISPECIES: LLM class flavin-dependent oxidoreductase [unclassified Sphingomonas]KQX23246.1 N5,N10-methylene tetrahydromethanopterin reductase [Sphingomonas sp. Root1294]KQY68094.1 N5,N10-methylene tetrahydromethanopterin reductase [Sphingomonas sp. Root50]KRB90986.1 N5,N10-methylene tetrahydromethanopterin reductase [Sphingomonas sp. Root720]
MDKQILINAFYMASPAQAWTGLWAHPDAQGERYNDLSYWIELARAAKKGLIDGIFLADTLGVADIYEGRPDAVMRAGGMFPSNDPMMLIPAMAAVTEHLCFGVTANTTYEPPYLLARRLSTLDHLTRGRLSWNVVTGILASTARAMGVEPVPHDRRYELASDYMELVYKLWEESWDNDAAVRDKASRTFTDPGRVRQVSHGGHYRCEGYHLCEPSPQRTPFIYAAGGSGKGTAFAGQHAEAAFTAAHDKPSARRIVDSYRKAAEQAGRTPDSIKVFNAVTVIVAPTEAEALDLKRQYADYSNEAGNLAMMSSFLGIDLSRYDPDDPIEYVESNAMQTAVEAMTKHNGGKKVRVRDIAAFADLPGREPFVVGSPEQVCDSMIDWIDETGLDGFNLVRTVEPAGLQSFIDLVVPRLQDRGRYKTQYAPGTMREKMFPEGGARRPADHRGAAFRHRAG